MTGLFYRAWYSHPLRIVALVLLATVAMWSLTSLVLAVQDASALYYWTCIRRGYPNVQSLWKIPGYYCF